METSTRRHTVLYAGHYLQLRQRDGWEFVARNHRVAVVVALTPGDELLLVEQFRVPVDGRAIELPAGLVGDEPGRENEALLEAARRELEEETGWRPGTVEPIMDCPTSAGMSDEMVVFVRARELERVGPGGGAGDEDISVHAIPRDGIDEWLRGQHARGLAIDPKIYTALYWLGAAS